VPQLHRQANFSSIFGYPPCRITAGKGVDIVAERIGGIVTSGVLSSLGLGDILITLGYSAGRKDHDRCDGPDLEARAAGWLLVSSGAALNLRGNFSLTTRAEPPSETGIDSARKGSILYGVMLVAT
jgi:hypothetical protein